MAKFTAITRSDFEDFLAPQGFVNITIPGTVELIYAKVVKVTDRGGPDERQFCLRIYSTINPNGLARDNGSDAIRVECWAKVRGSIIRVGGDKRVHRVEGWRGNLQARLDRWEDCIGPICPKCGMPTIEMKSGKGFRCASPGNRWVNNAWTVCDGVVWNSNKPVEQTDKQTRLNLAGAKRIRRHIERREWQAELEIRAIEGGQQ